MGAEGSKSEKKTYFSADEHRPLVQTLQKISNGRETVAASALESHIASYMNATYGKEFIRIISHGKSVSALPINGLVEALGPCLKGSMEERVLFTLSLAGGGKEGIESDRIIKYTEMLVAAYEKAAQNKEIRSWKSSAESVISQIAVALLHDLLFPKENIKKVWGQPPSKFLISYDAFENWWLGHRMFANLEMEIFRSCFRLCTASESLLPMPSQLPKAFPTMLSSAHVLFLNNALPALLQSEWRFLFSTTTHGWSFSIFMKQIVGKGPTILVIEDQSGNKFGGFASASWEVRPQFHGTPDSFLFALQPQAGIFHTTGYNTNFMYLNYLEKNTMPNGLGMGGREELFGIWLDYDFGKGTVAPTCTTFSSPQLSPHRELEIASIEVWAVGPEEEDSDEEEGTRKSKSALDKNPEARAMLDMMGKVAHSDGYREEED